MFYPGEIVYITESNLANFSCPASPYGNSSAACEILNVFYSSNSSHCQDIENMYTSCNNLVSNGNRWLTYCEASQTSMTSPTFGIQCDTATVYGNHFKHREHNFWKIAVPAMRWVRIQLFPNSQLLGELTISRS